jgi:hypothetical protein
MKLTPAQFRDAIGITQETLRHWRRVLPPYQGITGYAPVFTTGDLIAGAVIKTLVDMCGVSVSKFTEQSAAIARTCNETPWAELSQSVLVLSLSDATCVLKKSSTRTTLESLCISVPLGPILDGLTQAIISDADEASAPRSFSDSAGKHQQSMAGS